VALKSPFGWWWGLLIKIFIYYLFICHVRLYDVFLNQECKFTFRWNESMRRVSYYIKCASFNCELWLKQLESHIFFTRWHTFRNLSLYRSADALFWVVYFNIFVFITRNKARFMETCLNGRPVLSGWQCFPRVSVSSMTCLSLFCSSIHSLCQTSDIWSLICFSLSLICFGLSWFSLDYVVCQVGWTFDVATKEDGVWSHT